GGADISARNVRDLTPIDLAVNNGYYDIVQYLLGERNKRIKERVAAADTEAPAMPPARETRPAPAATPTRLDPPAEPAATAEPDAPLATVEPAVTPAPKSAQNTAQNTPETKIKTTDISTFKPDPAAQRNTPQVKAPDPEYSEKPSAFTRLGERFLSRFDFIADLFRAKKTQPEPAPKPSAPEQTAKAAPPAPTPAPAQPPTPAQLDDAETMMQELVESPAPSLAPAPTPAPPPTYLAKPAPSGIEPPKPQAAPAPDVAMETMPPTPRPEAAPKPQPSAQVPSEPEAAPKPSAPPRQTAAAPASREDPSAFKQFADRFVERFRELFGLEKSQTASKPLPPPAADTPNSLADTFKQTLERIRTALLPGTQKPATTDKPAPAKPQGPIILARPGETPPPPPGQTLQDDPSTFAEVPEAPDPGKPESAAVTADAAPDAQQQESPEQHASRSKAPTPLEAIEQDIAELVEAQTVEQKKTPAPPVRKQDKILANKEIDDALTQLAGTIKNLPPEQKPTAAAEAKQPVQGKGPLTQHQAEQDVLDLLMNEADKISGKKPHARAERKTPAESGPPSSKEVDATLSQLADSIEAAPTKQAARKSAAPAAKKPDDDLASALANIDSLSLTIPEPAKPAPNAAEQTPALPGLAPGPITAPATTAQEQSPLDKLPPIKTPSTENRQPTEIGARIRREAEKVAQQKPDFIERMTNVLQLNDSKLPPKAPPKDPQQAQIPSSPEAPSQWTAKVVKTARLDPSRDTDAKNRKKLQGPDKFLSGVSLTLGQSLKIGKEPLTAPKTGPDTRKPCIQKREGALAFCVETVDWPAAVAPYFEINTIMYQGTQAVIRYDEGRASNFFALFDSRAYGAIIDFYTKRYGPPTQQLQRGIAPLAQPRRANPVSIWRSIDPTTNLITTLEIRQFDDSRVGFPDTRRGAIMLYHAWSEPIFPQLSALELMVLKPKDDSDAGAELTPANTAVPQASAPAANPFSSFP
ncbi:MAG: hypothetical protein WD407_14825, partial [Rhodospirillales bacterium]